MKNQIAALRKQVSALCEAYWVDSRTGGSEAHVKHFELSEALGVSPDDIDMVKKNGRYVGIVTCGTTILLS